MTNEARETQEAPTVELRPAARAMAAVVRGVPDEALDNPTPCEEYAVRQLLQHVDDLSVAFRNAAHKNPGPGTRTAPGRTEVRPLAPDWRRRVPQDLEALVEAWRSPAAWRGSTQAGGVTLPAELAAAVALDELVLHGWDLARATGQRLTTDEGNLHAIHGMLQQAANERTDENPGLFGPPVPVAPDAPLLDQLVGLAGRDPHWRPGRRA